MSDACKGGLLLTTPPLDTQLRRAQARTVEPGWRGWGALPFLCLSFLVCQMGLQSPAVDCGGVAAVCQPKCPRGVFLFMQETSFLTW